LVYTVPKAICVLKGFKLLRMHEGVVLNVSVQSISQLVLDVSTLQICRSL